ncbi:MAG: pilus assembly protein PilZ [Spirochaetaceae bacterium]|jgi:hypothetical protein|nr:pilus assembly protein PilZ [Spirochaetaceae bacterium]
MGNGNNATDMSGKKVFFLCPTALVQNEMAAELIQQELEVYIVRDQGKLRRVLRKYPDSVVLICIDNGLPEKEWDAWIRTVMKDPATAAVSIGVLSGENNGALVNKYVNDIRVTCGYVVTRLDIKRAIIQVLANLKSVDAWGMRKFLRVNTNNDINTTINMPHRGEFIKGYIKDISVAGLSCYFELDPQFEKNMLISNIQVKLQSVLLKVEGIVFGSRLDGLVKVYVIIFTQRTDPSVRVKIRKFNQLMLQAKMDRELG